MRIKKRALTFEDVLLVPQHSLVLPKEVSIKSNLTKRVTLNTPIVSAAMDTVTEYKAAIAMAHLGGIGIIHKNMDIETQAKQITKVKKSESGIIIDPIYIAPNKTVADADALMGEYKISASGNYGSLKIDNKILFTFTIPPFFERVYSDEEEKCLKIS